MVLSIFTLIANASYHNHIVGFLGISTSCAFKDLKLTIITNTAICLYNNTYFQSAFMKIKLHTILRG